MSKLTSSILFKAALLGGLTALGPIYTPSAHAQAASSAIQGMVVDETGQPIEGVRVRIVGASQSAFTDPSGEFILTGVAVGDVQVEADYIGAAPVTEALALSIEGVRGLVLSIDRGQELRMDILTVIGERIGGINTERSAINKLSAITGESAANLPDINAAEAIQRLPGVYIDEDRGEGRFVSIRGASSSFNSVNLNGIELGSPEGDGLSVPLDVFAAGGIEGIVVTKAVTPSQPGNSVGGRIDITTPTAFGKEDEAKISIRGGWHDLGSGERWRAAGGIRRTFGNDDQFGFSFDANFSTRDLLAETVEMLDFEDGWDLETFGPGDPSGLEGTFWVPNEIEFRDQRVERERLGFNTILEWSPRDEARLFAQVSYSQFTEDELRNRLITPLFARGSGISGNIVTTPAAAIDASLNSGTTSELPTFGVVTAATINQTDRRELDTQRDLTVQDFWIATIGGEWSNETWDLSGAIGYSDTFEDRDRQSLDFRIEQTEYDVTFDATGDPVLPTLAFSNGGDPTDPSNFRFDDFDIFFDDREDKIVTLIGDAGRDFELEYSTLRLEFGARFTSRERSEIDDGIDYNDPAAGNNSFLLSDPLVLTPQLNDNFLDGAYSFGPGVSRGGLDAVIRDADTLLTFNSESFENEGDSEEEILAGYIQSTWTRGPMTILGGVRVEQTDYTITADQTIEVLIVDAAGNEIVEDEVGSPAIGSNSYTNVLPSIHFRYDLTEDVILRASAGQTIRRPSFFQLSPNDFTFVQQDDQGGGSFDRIVDRFTDNPELEPLQSNNFEISIDAYLDTFGAFGAALFYKDISNITVTSSSVNTIGAADLDADELAAVAELGGSLTGDFLVREFTLDSNSSGEIAGLELSYSNKFEFLPAPFDGLGVDANVTFTDSEQTIPIIGDDADGNPIDLGEAVFNFEGQSDTSGNVTLVYEKGPFDARLTYAYVEGFLADIELVNSNSLRFQNIYDQDFGRLGAKVQYEIRDGIKLSWEGNNLNDEYLERRFDNSQQLREYERNGWWMEFGVSAEF